MNNAQILRDRLWPHSQIRDAQILADYCWGRRPCRYCEEKGLDWVPECETNLHGPPYTRTHETTLY